MFFRGNRSLILLPLVFVAVFVRGTSPATPDSHRVDKVGCGISESALAERVFEGVEKRIEVRFTVQENDVLGLRAIGRSELDTICEAAKCTIIHSEPDTCFDSYILSESSLFVFRDRMMIKTCGTTLPLNGVQAMFDAADQYNIKPLDMTYSRSSFVFPDLQLFPHDSLDNELKFLKDMESTLGKVISEETFILGDIGETYWVVHNKKFDEPSSVLKRQQVMVDCIMTGLAPEARDVYWKDMRFPDSHNDAAMSVSIESFEKSLRIVGKSFDPCGFSANAHGSNNENYMTVHVTPEEGFSYASVEAVFNGKFEQAQLDGFVQKVVDAFRPKNLLVTLMSQGTEHIELGHIVDPIEPAEYNRESFGEREFSGDACASNLHVSAYRFVRPDGTAVSTSPSMP